MISLSDVAYVLGMNSSRLNRWYKEVLSGFRQEQERGELYEKDVKLKGGETLRVPIMERKNIGQFIGIDEKHIAGIYHTILYNLETSKIILAVRSTKSADIYKAIIKHFTNEEMFNVLVVTKDAADNFDWVARQAFPRATRILDKFHVIKYVLDSLSDLRIYFKHKYAIETEQKKKLLASQYDMEVKKAKETNSPPPVKQFYQLKERTLSNGDTIRQLLTRSKHLLRLHKDQWNEEQRTRAELLFLEFPDLEKIHNTLIKFKTWYSIGNLKENPLKLNTSFDGWIAELNLYKNYFPIQSTIHFLKKHKADILNYFDLGFTNAVAESVNRKINALIYKSFGIRDLDFFYFRTRIYLA